MVDMTARIKALLIALMLDAHKRAHGLVALTIRSSIATGPTGSKTEKYRQCW
jgi:hypothetical protein